MLENEVVAEGNPNCKHEYVDHEHGAFEEEDRWTCDIPSCGREEIATSEEDNIIFPSGSYIRNTNAHKYGGAEVYSHRADSNGVAYLLDESERISRGDVLAKFARENLRIAS